MDDTPIRTKGTNGHVTHWWQALSAVPCDKGSPAYERLQRVWFDHTRFLGASRLKATPKEYAKKRKHEFLHPGHETHLTVSLWENFSIFPASDWLPRLYQLACLPSLPAEGLRCQWAYEWAGYRPATEPGTKRECGMCDVVLEYERSDGMRGALVVEAKNLDAALGEKEMKPNYYLGIEEFADYGQNVALLYLVDESVRAKVEGQLGERALNVGVISWQQLAGLQIQLTENLGAAEPVRNFVAGAIQFQFAQHDIRPARLSASYLDGEMSMTEMDALPKPEQQAMSVHSEFFWRI